MENELMEDSPGRAPSRSKSPDDKQLLGSINDKYPVVLSDGRTVVYISDKSKEAEIRLKYELLKDKKFPTRNPRHHL
jgi:topoisomerase IA-like protein